MTSWQVSGILIGMVAYVVAWVWGGRPERLAVGILVFYGLLSSMIYKWDLDSSGMLATALNSARLLAFGYLCLRFDRWWPYVITAALVLMVFIHSAKLMDPSISQFTLASAAVGLGYLIDLVLLLSICERWLSGEPPAGPAAWARAGRTQARAKRSKGMLLVSERGLVIPLMSRKVRVRSLIPLGRRHDRGPGNQAAGEF